MIDLFSVLSHSAPLLTTLSHYIKKSKIAEGQMSECLDILSQLTGVNLEMSVPNTVVVHHGVAPLLLRDPITVFMQLYANMPPHLASGEWNNIRPNATER